MFDKGTAQSSTSTTIVLAESASETDDQYNTHRVYLTGGTGEGQSRVITDYVGSTRTATVAEWGTTPDSTTTYEVREILTGTPTVTASTVTLSNKHVSTETVWLKDGTRVIAGQAVQYAITGGTAGANEVTVTATTTSTPAQTLVRIAIDTVE